MTLPELFIDTINKYDLIQHKDHILIGLSGGPDSVCLFHLLRAIAQDYQLKIAIAHINYHLREGESEKEALWIRDLTENSGIPLYQKDSPINTRVNIQLEARNIRYRFFKQIMDEFQFNKLILGHHLDDQLETFMLRLMRGSSITGLGAMSLKTVVNSINIVRPLLHTPKSIILNYLHQHQHHYFTDSSNLKEDYLRNKIRLKLFPVLEEIYPDYRPRLAKVIDYIKEENHFMDSIVSKEMEPLMVFTSYTEKRIDLTKLNLLPLSFRKKILVNLSRELGHGWNYFSNKNLDIILNLAEQFDCQGSKQIFSKKDIDIYLEYSHLTIYLKQNRPMLSSGIVLEKNKPISLNETNGVHDPWQLELSEVFDQDEIKNLNKAVKKSSLTMYINQDNLDKPLMIRPIKKGDRIFLGNSIGLKKVKEILINAKIPAKKRQEVLLICHDQAPIAIISLPPFFLIRLSEQYYINNFSKKMLKLSIKKRNIPMVFLF